MPAEQKRLGSGRAAPVSFCRPTLDGTLVVGTDGLWSYTTPDKVAEAVRGRTPAGAAEELLPLVRLPSGMYQDDVGVAVVAPVTR
jgi:serine/threonine protein phosphatase PrpC